MQNNNLFNILDSHNLVKYILVYSGPADGFLTALTHSIGIGSSYSLPFLESDLEQAS